MKQSFAALAIVLTLCACTSEPAPVADSADPPSPETASELIERTGQALDSTTHRFELVETHGDEEIRTGTIKRYPSDSQPTFDLSWTGDEGSVLARSDGREVSVRRSDGSVTYSGWSEAGSVLYGDAAGKLVSAAMSPSSFAAYGAKLAPASSSERLRLEVPLPSGGGWSMEIATDDWLPVLVGFRASAESADEVLTLRATQIADAEPPTQRLSSEDGAEATPFYAGPSPGDAAPNVTFELADGSSIALADLLGSVVVLDFWATWCAPCRPAMQKLDELYRKDRERGLEVFGLRLMDSGDPTSFLESLNLAYPIGDGTPFLETYAIGTYGLPTLYLIDREGKIAKLIVGFTDESKAALEQAVEQALAR